MACPTRIIRVSTRDCLSAGVGLLVLGMLTTAPSAATGPEESICAEYSSMRPLAAAVAEHL